MTGKYEDLYAPFIERVSREESPKYKTERERTKAVKGKLHRLHGAYLDEAAHKKAEALTALLCDAIRQTGETFTPCIQERAAALLRLHASTRERLPCLGAFYAFIYDTLGPFETIMDIGCGYNPFSIPWMPPVCMPKRYYACDLDVRAAGLINRFFVALGLPETARCLDLAVETPDEQTGLALVCKLLPVLESQQKGRGFRLLNELNAACVVVTYPLKSLCGKEKGFALHYAGAFEEALREGSVAYKLAGKAEIGNELVYALRR